MPQAPNNERTLMLEMETTKKLMTSLRQLGADDDADLVADSLEGETNLLEALAVAIDEIDECEIHIVGLDEKIKAFDTRKKQKKDKAERIRALIEQALVATGQTSLKLATATLSLTKRPPQLVVADEADIPARFWVEQERPAPKLDKKALADALKADEEIPGAALDNGSVSLTVRRR